jgi:thiosulfate dehydrogenase (quinone) large subunit
MTTKDTGTTEHPGTTEHAGTTKQTGTTRYSETAISEIVHGPGEGTLREQHLARRVFAALRLVIGFVFVWAFVDKLFGFGYATPSAKSWINGGSPTKGFLSSADGPFAGMYHAMAGVGWVNWLFMLALLGIGTALMLGIGMRIAAAAGALLYLTMWFVVLPPETNPVFDDHTIGLLAVIGLALVHAGDTWGLGAWWRTQPIVNKNRWLI